MMKKINKNKLEKIVGGRVVPCFFVGLMFLASLPYPVAHAVNLATGDITGGIRAVGRCWHS